MYQSERDLLANLVVLTPKLARRKFRQDIFDAWGWKCAYCDKQLTEGTATIDHILPKHKGGQNIRQNMACCCRECNMQKNTQNWQTWFRNQSYYCVLKENAIKSWIEQSYSNIPLHELKVELNL